VSLPWRAQHLLAGGLRARGAQARRPRGGDLFGLLLERQGVRLGAPRHRGGADRCGAGGRGRLAVPHHALRLSLPAAGVARPLHGTGTPSNDEAESRAVSGVLGTQVPASSTKGATGHTLGAAGALEAVICALALRHGLMPAGVNTNEVDPALAVHYLLENRAAPLSCVMSNSFGFGGSNCCLIFGRAG